MKKLMALLVVLILCASMACPVFADAFVPSIGYKDTISIVTGKDEDGEECVGQIQNAAGEVLGYVYDEEEGCLLVTPISQVVASELLPDAAENMMLMVYNALQDGSMKLPYEKFSDKLDPSKMVIRELIDVTWLCSDHPEILEPAGVHVEITFDLGLEKGSEVYVMSYKHGEWNPIVSSVNNDDGTVTCVFEDFCPVAFSVYTGSELPPAQTGDTANLTLWISLMAVSALALVAVVVFRRKAAR